MDLLDDLDDAFDDIFADKKDGEEDHEQRAGIATFGEMPPDLQELTAAIAGQNIAPVQALLANASKLRRAYLLAALHGAVKYVKGVEQDPARSELLQQLYGLTLTKRGQVRQVLAKSQLQAMLEVAAQLGGADGDTVKYMRLYMQQLIKLDAIEREDVVKLFQVGLCSPERMLQAPVDEAVSLSGLFAEQIQAIQQALQSL